MTDHDNTNDHHEHGPMCPHNEHWHDDYAFTDEERLPIPDGAPTMHTVIDRISKTFDDDNNPVVYRFAMVYVNAESGQMQIVTNPGMGSSGTINLLSHAVSTLAFQEDYHDRIQAATMGAAIQAAFADNDGTISDFEEMLSKGLFQDELFPEARAIEDITDGINPTKMDGGYL